MADNPSTKTPLKQLSFVASKSTAMLQSLARKLYCSRYFGFFVIINIFFAVLVQLALSEIDWDHDRNVGLTFYFLKTLETVSLCFLVAEYLIRIFSSARTWRSFLKPWMLFDALVILAFFVNSGLVVVRMIKFFKILSVLRLGRTYIAYRGVLRVLRNKRDEVVISIMFFLVLVLVFAYLMYAVEGGVNETFSSASASLWWAVITATSVGYGDAVPQTSLGKFLGGIMAILGVVVNGLVISVLASGFLEEFRGDVGGDDSLDEEDGPPSVAKSHEPPNDDHGQAMDIGSIGPFIEHAAQAVCGSAVCFDIRVEDVSIEHAGHNREAANGGTHFTVSVLLKADFDARLQRVLLLGLNRGSVAVYQRFPSVHSIEYKLVMPGS